MQTFLPSPNPVTTARWLDSKRLNKQILECYQILNVLSGKSPTGGWRNHPAVLMWKGYERGLWNYIQAMIQEAKNRGATTDFIDKQVKALEALKAAQQGITEATKRGPGKAAAKITPEQTIQDAYGKAAEKLNELTNVGKIVSNSADMMGAAFGQAFQDIINGSASAQDALAGMMKSIGENFVNMAAQIIAQQMTMIILGSILKALGIAFNMGGSWSGDSSKFGSFSGGDFNVGSMDVSGLSGAGALSPGGFYGGGKIGAVFAEGGFVTGPTQAIVGEGGQPEYIIPASKMQAAMARYSAGARGDAVIPSDGGTGPAGGTATMAAPTGTIDIRYTVERINTVDYVTADQFQRGMAQAAQQGAAQGEQRTLRRLQQSRTTRSRLGMA